VRHSGTSSPAHGAHAHLLGRRRSTRTPRTQPTPQSQPMRMIPAVESSPLRLIRTALRGLYGLVLVDLPVDVVVVLEQQERADQVQAPEEAPRERWCVG
jgi:hypothetical protein